MAKKLTSEKAKEILRDKSVHGKPLTEKQKKFFGAIAGGAKPYKAEDGGWLDRYETPSAQTGITTCPPGFVNIEGKCFDRSSDAYKKLYQYGIGYMDDKDVLVSSRMDLPEVVLKPKAALDFLDRIDASDRTRYSFDQMTKKFGAIPNIKPKGKSSFIAEELFKFFDPSNKDRELSRTATYDPFTKTARVDNMEEYISELAHHADKNILESAPYRFLRYDLPNRLKGKNLYDVPGTDEYIAHSIIEPQIKDFINKDSGYVDEILLPRIIDSRSPEERKRIMGEAWTEYVPPTENKKREGGVLKQKTTDNYGTKPNANNSDVSLPPGFKGWAYNTKGRNYSPAWGGQFAMGGNLPGATGMMYARTINPAPSNGPYAKKTKASAQDGKKLSYNQWKKQYNLKETPDYNLKRAWELGYAPDKTGHLPTVDNQTGEFLKAKGHPTLQLELDWYNSPEAADFRSKNIIDSSGKFFKYVPKSQNGQEMKYYQEGLDFKPKTISQDGTVIDPMGYWNPENWGKPVTIPSNEITMEGVYEPLIGISDTGDVQYMEPGEDYQFDGDYVTEYPVAQKGIQLASMTNRPGAPSPKSNVPVAKRTNIPTEADSLRVYNAAVALMNYYKNDKRHKAPEINVYDPIIERADIKDLGSKNLDEYRQMYRWLADPDLKSMHEIYKKDYGLTREELLKRIGKAIVESKSAPEGVAYYKDAYPSKIDINAPSAVIDYRIAPQGFMNFFSSVPRDSNKIPMGPEPAGAVTGLYYYDPLAVKPYSMRTEKEKIEWEKKYGKPKPQPKPKPTSKPKPAAPKPAPEPQKVKEAPVTPEVVKKPILTDYFQGPSVFAPTPYGGGAAFVGYKTPQGDTVFVKPEDYERMGVPEYGKKFIESKKKQRNGGVNNADAQPIEKLDQLLNFTNYNKPTKGGWLNKYQ